MLLFSKCKDRGCILGQNETKHVNFSFVTDAKHPFSVVEDLARDWS